MRHTLRFTRHGNHHVGLLRRRHRFINHLLRRAWINLHRFLVQIKEVDDTFIISDVGAFGIDDFALIAQRLLHSGQHGDRLIGHARR